MTRIVLIRHAHSQANARGILAGRMQGIALSENGSKQAQDLVARLGDSSISHIRVSPMERCLSTIDPWIASDVRSRSKKLTIDEDLSEVDYGQWSGKKLTSLYRHKLWKTVQERPSAMYFPEGEGLASMQVRAMKAVARSVDAPGKGARILVSHGDVIKSIIAATLGMHLDQFQKIVIDPASISILDFNGHDGRVLLLNDSHSTISDIVNSGVAKRALLGGGSGRTKAKASGKY
jgi:probable phosphomutase (TIGR03848 family)